MRRRHARGLIEEPEPAGPVVHGEPALALKSVGPDQPVGEVDSLGQAFGCCRLAEWVRAFP